MGRGQMNHRLSFQKRQFVSDGFGNEEGEFAEEFVRWVEIKPSLGIETTNAARLAGQQPVDITVDRDSETRDIEADWQAVDVHDGTVYALTSPTVDMKQKRQYLTMKAVIGVAA